VSEVTTLGGYEIPVDSVLERTEGGYLWCASSSERRLSCDRRLPGLRIGSGRFRSLKHSRLGLDEDGMVLGLAFPDLLSLRTWVTTR
jgi:hypothetical protein